MDNKEQNKLVVVKENVFLKIKIFFRRLFFKKEYVNPLKEMQQDNVNNVENKENNFINNVKINAEEYEEKNRLLKLQTLIEEDVIQEDELPEEDTKEINKLYDIQILSLKQEIYQLKNDILKLKTSNEIN